MASAGGGMTVVKEPSGRFRARLKSGRTNIASRTFDTKREAQAWLNRERAALTGGVDPRAGKPTVRSLLPVWLEERQHTVSTKTYGSDAALRRLTPTALAALSVGSVTSREVSRALVTLTRSRFGRGIGAPVPRLVVGVLRVGGTGADDLGQSGHRYAGAALVGADERRCSPLASWSWSACSRAATQRNERLAELLLIDAWTGLAVVGAAGDAGSVTSLRFRCRSWSSRSPRPRGSRSR